MHRRNSQHMGQAWRTSNAPALRRELASKKVKRNNGSNKINFLFLQCEYTSR